MSGKTDGFEEMLSLGDVLGAFSDSSMVKMDCVGFNESD